MKHPVDFLLKNRTLVLVATVMLVLVGLASWHRLPIDAFPDMSNQQVMILSEAPALGPLDVEQQITFPIETVMGGLPDLKQVRSVSKTGLSQVVIVFEDHVDTYFARQLVFERLQLAKESLPPGVDPEMGPISTGLGEVFQYTLRSESHDETELRTIQDWMVAPQLRILPGVNEVNSFGGKVRQIQVLVSPERLIKYDLTFPDVIEALADKIIEMTGSKSEKRFLSYEEAYGRPFDDMMRRVPCLDRLRETVGYEPKTGLTKILESVIEEKRRTLGLTSA